jgi:hypothetical protein
MRFGMQRRMARRLVTSSDVADEPRMSEDTHRVTRQADSSIRLLGRPFFVPAGRSTGTFGGERDNERA